MNNNTNKRCNRIIEANAGKSEYIEDPNRTPSLDVYKVSDLEESSQGLGLIGRMSFAKQSLKASLASAKVRQQHDLDCLQIQADARKRELLAFYRAKSAQVAERLNTFLQDKLFDEETERLQNVNRALANAAAVFHKHMDELEDSLMADAIKEKLAGQYYHAYETACNTIQHNVLMRKYGTDIQQ
jgi:hypothetical protein